MRTLEELEAFVADEAQKEGPQALADLQAQHERFRLAREIVEMRKSLKLTQIQLSARSGVPQSEISKIESGAANATETTLLRLLHPLGHTLGLIPIPKKMRGSFPPKRKGRSTRTARRVVAP